MRGAKVCEAGGSGRCDAGELMDKAVIQILDAFDALTSSEQQLVAAELIRRGALAEERAATTWDELSAELFQAYDAEEMADSHGVRATQVQVRDTTLDVSLTDGQVIAVPLAWYPRLTHATTAERQNWSLIDRGCGIHWPAIDEDISVANLLNGQPSTESLGSLKKWLAGRPTPPPRRRTNG